MTEWPSQELAPRRGWRILIARRRSRDCYDLRMRFRHSRAPAFLVALLAWGWTAAQERPGAFPMTIQEIDGAAVRLEEPPRRIVSLNPGNSEILSRLLAEERLAGVDEFSRGALRRQDIPVVGSLLHPSFERILAADPDLVLITEMSDQHRPKLESLGLKVLRLNPRKLEDVFQAILQLGQMVERSQRAEEVVQELRQRVEKVRQRTAGIPEEKRPQVFVEIWPEPLQSAGPGTFIHQLIELAGGRNVAHDALSSWPLMSLETVLERNPDVILTPQPASRDRLL
ncbi:MAG TPA: ABC transporter substrate-binding protein, partial [Acidobacteriota bacterium]|nr:ABC transporter substrate-binding protein [Acidobacteriota bacterium]